MVDVQCFTGVDNGTGFFGGALGQPGAFSVLGPIFLSYGEPNSTAKENQNEKTN